MLFQGKPHEILVIVPREDTDEVLQSIEKVIQIEEFKFPKLRKIYPERIKIVEILSKLETFAEELETKGELEKFIKDPIKESEKLIELIESEIEKLNNKEREVKYREKRLRAMIELLDESEFIGLVCIITKSLEEWELFQSKLQTEGIRVISSKEYEHEAIAIAKGMEGEYSGDDKKIRKSINKDLDKLKKELDELSKKKKEISNIHGPKINSLKKQLEFEIELLEEKKKIAHSELFTFIKGIVERKKVPIIEKMTIILMQPKIKKGKGFGQKYLKVIKGVISRKNV
jgi:hypothetical protein